MSGGPRRPLRRPLARPGARALVLALVSGCSWRQPTVVVAPHFEAGDAELLGEAVTLRCEDEGAAPRCELVADYQVRAEVRDPVATVTTRAVEHVELADAGGVVPPHERTQGRDELVELPALGQAQGAPDDEEQWQTQRHRVDAKAGERTMLRLRARFVPRPVRRLRLAHSPALGRHVAMSELLGLEPCVYDRSGCEFRVIYARASSLASGREQAPRVLGLDHAVGPEPEPEEAEGAVSYDLELHGRRRVFAPGGPVLGLGVAFEDIEVAKARFGWELFVPTYVAHALAVEIDGRRRVTLVPSTELMSPLLVVLPSIGLGVGAPIQLVPELLVGLRGQLSVQLPYLGVLVTADVFPARYELGVRPSLFLQFVL